MRYAVSRASLACFGPAFSPGTLFVDVVGGLLMGLLAEVLLTKGGGTQQFRLFLTIGVVGGFTAFSALSLEAALMLQRGEYAHLAFYIIASVLLPITAVFLGMTVVRSVS